MTIYVSSNNNKSYYNNILKEDNKIKLNKLINVLIYKSKKCDNKKTHDKNKCLYYHNTNDYKRSLLKKYYQIHLFKIVISNDNNLYCNNKIELLYHPNYYKTKYCINYYSKGICDIGEYCSFAHSDSELRIKILHYYKFDYNFFLFLFKTEFCPLGIIDHNRKYCIYAHNYQDFKRKNISKLNNKLCSNWNISKNYIKYNTDCKLGINCYYLHGWLEFYFHPLNYKTKKCENSIKNCKNNILCYKYHDNDNIMNNNDNLCSKYFEIVPTNRTSNI